VEQQLTKIIYEGLWYSPLKAELDAFVEETQKTVTGTVRVKLFKGTHTVVARKSPYSLYNEELATYLKGDSFDHNAAVGFIKLWGLPTKVFAEIQENGKVLNQ
ncbi:MAG: argininosuccinate synthase, partial [Bacillus sp. (in: Bacteria)]|nr:argininosuccinate synthase [Bacillus sp. (in: firmicutes)]